MSDVTTLAEVTEQIQKFWSPVTSKELRESTLMSALVNKDYDGQIKRQGDTVKVRQISAPTGKLRTIGTDADVFETEKLITTNLDIKADKRATVGLEFQDLVEIQSLINGNDQDVRQGMRYAIEKQINDYLKTLVAPQATPVDHTITGVADFNAAQLADARMRAGQAKWLYNKPWYCLVDSSYYKDLLNAQTLSSSDYVGGDQPNINGQIGTKRFGFNILEDNSKSTDTALLFHPDFLHLVMQTEVQFKISDMHSQKKFGYVMSLDVIFGAKQGINGAALCQTVTA